MRVLSFTLDFRIVDIILSIKFSQILTQIVIKKQYLEGINIFITVSFWNINKTISFPSY